MTIFQIVLINLGALITALGGVFLKRLSVSVQDPVTASAGLMQFILNPYLWAGGACYVLPIFFWIYLLRTMELTKLQPMLSIVYVYTIALAFLWLGEQPTPMRLAGIGFVVFGVILVGRT